MSLLWLTPCISAKEDNSFCWLSSICFHLLHALPNNITYANYAFICIIADFYSHEWLNEDRNFTFADMLLKATYLGMQKLQCS